MATLAQDSSGDFQLTEGRLSLVTNVDEECALKLRNRLLAVRGEWFLDQRVGLPYFEEILVKNPNLKIVKRIFEKAILATPPVEAVVSLDLTLLPSRELQVSFRVRTESGATISAASLDQPFIVENA